MQDTEILVTLKNAMRSIIEWLNTTREPYFGATFLSISIALGVTALITELFTRTSGDGGEDD